MTRRRIIAGVILLAAVVVAAPRVWEKLAYREYRLLASLANNECVMLKKRWSWLPGEDPVFPKQLCPYCEDSRHYFCFEAQPALLIDLVRRQQLELYLDERPDLFLCTCTDPLHDD